MVSAAGGHLGLCSSVCRPTAPASDQYNIGWLPNATANFQSDSTGAATFQFTDNLIALNGYRSIIVCNELRLLSTQFPMSIIHSVTRVNFVSFSNRQGRSMVLHNSNTTRIGFCVIGRNDMPAAENANPLVDGMCACVRSSLSIRFLFSLTEIE
jgi:hypothetical protein